MKAKLSFLARSVILLWMLVVGSVVANAWTTLCYRTTDHYGETGGDSNYNFTKVNDNEFYYEINPSSTGDVYFRIYVSNDGGKQIYPQTDNANPGATGTTSVNFDSNYTDYNFKVSVESGKTYRITANYLDEGGWKWKISFNEVSAPIAQYYIKHNWNGEGNWTWKGPLTDNGDGTYSLTDKYGDAGCNWNTKNEDGGSTWIEKNSLNIASGIQKGDNCVFTLNPSAGTISITKKSAVSYTITYNLNGGTNPGGAPTNYDGTSVVALPTPTYAGHTFEGWYDNASFTGSVITSILVGASGNKTYWAKWADIASVSLPTEKRESGKIMILSKNKEAKAAWLWYDGKDGVGYNMRSIGTYNSKYLGYYDNVLDFTNCLPLENSVTDGTVTWGSSWVKLTSTKTESGSGDVIINTSLKKSDYIDNIMFFEFDGTKKTVAKENAGKFSPFIHIGATSTLSKETVTVEESVTISTSGIVGTLKDGAILSYYLVDGENKVTSLPSNTFSAPTTPGEYTVYAYIEDPYHFELQKTGEMPLIVNAETFTVTYAAGGATSGSVPTDSKKYKQGETAIVLGNTGALAKEGQNFTGWSDGPNTYSVGSSITVNSNVTLTAQWVAQAVASINASHPSGTNFTVATNVTFSVNNAISAKISIDGAEPEDISLTNNAGSKNWPVEDDCTITITAKSTDNVVTTRTFNYTVGNVDSEAYYLVSPTLTNGKKLESYKFSNVLHRKGQSVDQNLLTLTMSDFLMRNMREGGTEEYPDNNTIDYWVEKGDGTVVFYPKGGTKIGSYYYPGFNDSGVKYVYVSNVRFKGDHQMYISVNDGDYQKMTYVADAKANGEGGLWCYRLGSEASYKIVINDYGIAAGVPQTDLKTRTTSTINNSKLIRLADYGNYGHDYEWYSTVTVNNAPAEDTEEIPAADFALGSTNNKMFDAGLEVTGTHTYEYTKTQTEAYPYSCNATKEPTAVPSTHFTLTKTIEQKSYTWYLNVGNNSYENAKHFTIPAKGVAIAINNTFGDRLHAIKELPTNGSYSYSVIGNTTKGSSQWESPSTSKLEMQRTAFYKDSNGDVRTKVLLTDGDFSEVSAKCDSIVYLVTITKPSGANKWPPLYMGFAPEVTINKFEDKPIWYQCAIRPQVFRDKDANVHYGGLEWTGVRDAEGYKNTIGKQTDQTITPQNIDQFTSFVLHMNVTNATYWIAYSGETEDPDDGFFICGPAVAGSSTYENWTKKIKGENPDKTPNAAVDGNAVRMTYDPETESYVATLNLTENKKFRFLDTSWDKAYYQEDAILPARDGELGNTKWQSAKTWETDYFNNTSLGQSFNVTDDGAIDFKLKSGTYTVRFYFKKIKTIVDGKTTYDATPYYTIDYHINVGDAEAFGTDLNKGAGSAFAFHKTWSSRLAYVNNGLDAYYVSGWNWKKDNEKKTATASVTLDRLVNPAYLAANMPMIVTDNAKHEDKLYVIVPGDPYGLQQAVKNCYRENFDDGISVRPIYETEDYSAGMNSQKGSTEWLQWSDHVGPGAYNTATNAYTTRNFTFAMIVPTWNTDKKKELDFWRVKSTNEKMTGHKFLVVASVPQGTKDLESGNAFTSYQSGGGAKSMANYMTISIEGDDDIVTDIQNVQSEEEIVSNGRIYNLMGVEVKTPIRGQVYIINGRKAIMK